MSGDSGEKTKKPTSKKIRESRKKGDVAKVPTIPKLLALIAVLELTLAMRDVMWDQMEGWMTHALTHVPYATGNLGNYALASLVSAPLMSASLVMCVSLALLASVFALIGNIIQTGLVFSPEAIPKGQYLDPVSNAKQMLGGEQWINLLLNVVKVLIIGFAVALSIALSLDDILHLADGDLKYMFNTVLDMIGRTERFALLFIFVCVVIDWATRKHFQYKQMMMTHEEWDREMREEYGNKHTRQQRKKITNELMMGEVQKVKKADAVVVNPTHFAVALLYSPRECPLPIVIVRGSNEMALAIREIARRDGIPIVRSVWLARTLYAVGREGKPIPRMTLKAVAAVYRAILALPAQDRPEDEVIDLDPDTREDEDEDGADE